MFKHISILSLCMLPLFTAKAVEVDDSVLDSIAPSLDISYLTIEYIDTPIIDTPIIDTPVTEVSYFDSSKTWDEISFIAAPTVNYLNAYYDCFGLTKTYYPESISYYGYKWIRLKERESQEGFTREISDEWVKLFKGLKPYIK